MKTIVNMACGLANRMFQYSYYLYLKKNGYNVCVDFYRSARLPHENVDWHRIFPNAYFEQASKLSVLKMGGGPGLLPRFMRRYMPSLTSVLNMPTAFDAFLPDKEKDQYIIGVFQNADIVQFVSIELRKAFRFTDFTDKHNLSIAYELSDENAVAIHVRKGNDYQQRIWYQNTCPMTYYRNAIDLIHTRIPNPKLFIFTDNPDWVKQHFCDFDYRLVTGNPGAGWGSHFDMQLMTLCRNIILSNSTYSWWSAFLNTHSQNLVIIPRIWFNPEAVDNYTSAQLLCKEWIQL